MLLQEYFLSLIFIIDIFVDVFVVMHGLQNRSYAIPGEIAERRSGDSEA
jgi:hypothetical protein